MTNVVRRVVLGMGANAFGLAINVGMQLFTLPLYLHFWGLSKYGTWLVISAIPSYFSMADVGIVTAAGNEMTMALGRGDVPTANRIFQSAFAFMLITCGTVALIGLLAVITIPIGQSMDSNQRVALATLILSVLLTLFGGLSEAIFKASGRYAFGTNLSNLVRLSEWVGNAVGLIAFGSFSGVALSGLSLRIVGLAATIVLSNAGTHGLKWGLNSASSSEVRRMTKPAIAFMAFPLANAIGFQGMTILLATILGTGAVAVFNAYRTLARVAVQVTSIFSYALWAEFGRHLGGYGLPALQRMYSRAFGIGILIAVCLSISLYVVGPWILSIWTHGAIQYESRTMLIMLLYAAIAGSWHVPRVLLMSTNKHANLALWALSASTLSVAFAAFLCPSMSIYGAAISMLASELMIALICATLVQTMFKSDRQRDGKGLA